jgi:hypothetical protein
MRSKDCFQLKYNNNSLQEIDEFKSTNSSYNIINLLNNLTERYSILPNSDHKILFLEKIQIPILREYLSEIDSELKERFKWGTFYHSYDQLQFYSMLLNSINYVQNVLKEWGEKLVISFIQLLCFFFIYCFYSFFLNFNIQKQKENQY